MKTELRRACPNCGNEFSGAMGVTYKAVAKPDLLAAIHSRLEGAVQ